MSKVYGKTEFAESSGNAFADLELPDSGELFAKAQLARVIRERIRERKLTQAQAASQLGTDQARVSEVINGKVAAFTYERLIRFLIALECDVEIRITNRKDGDRRDSTVVACG